MIYNQLGKTNLMVSALSYGAAPLGEEYGEIDMNSAVQSVHAAIDKGINYFDVAPYYGRYLAEKRLGNALKGKRHKVYLATKVGRYKSAKGEFFNFTADGIYKSAEESLQRLKTDYIDIYQAHDIEFVPKEMIINEALPAMKRLQNQGKIRFIGITSYMLNVLKSVAIQFEVDSILSYSRYNLLDTSLNDVLKEVIVSKNIGLINASPLNMRLLTSKGRPDWHPAPAHVVECVKNVADYCKSVGTSIECIAMQFALSNHLPATTLVGMSNPRNVLENIAMMNEKIDRSIMEKVFYMMAPVKNTYWEEGIPENFDPGCVPRFA